MAVVEVAGFAAAGAAAAIEESDGAGGAEVEAAPLANSVATVEHGRCVSEVEPDLPKAG